MTLLSILGSNCIAVPLSSGFPASELRYILDNSEALMLLSSEKFKEKAQEVLKEGLEKKPMLGMVEKRQGGEGGSSDHVQLEGTQENQAGMMLYTSGTTSRPVRTTPCLIRRLLRLRTVERRGPSRTRLDRPSSVTSEGLELHTKRPPPPRSPTPPYPRYHQRAHDTTICRLDNRIHVPL